MKRVFPFLVFGFLLFCSIFIGMTNFVILRNRMNKLENTVMFLTDYQTKKVLFIRRHLDKLKNEKRIKELDAYEILSSVYDIGVEKYGLEGELILSLIEVESNFIKESVSPKGAEGLMQIFPPTGRLISNSLGKITFDLKDIEDNIEFGSYYLKMLIEQYGERKALSIYNGGRKWTLAMEYADSVLDGKKNWR